MPHEVAQEPGGEACLALMRTAKALSLSAADCLLGGGARLAPISSTLLMRALSLAALCKRLACTLGVGGRQGRTAAVAAGPTCLRKAAGVRSGGRLLERVSLPDAPCLGRSEESLVMVVVWPPPSANVVTRWLFAAWVTTPRRQAA